MRAFLKFINLKVMLFLVFKIKKVYNISEKYIVFIMSFKKH